MQPVPRQVSPGEQLRQIRMRRGMTTRQVAELSQSVAVERNNPEYAISHARLVQVENEQSSPSVFKLFTLSVVYGVSLTELLGAYVDTEAAGPMHLSMPHAHTHLSSFDAVHKARTVPIPIRAGTDRALGDTNLLAQIVDVWGEIPVSVLERLNLKKCRYGVIGLSDYTMYPLIRPGSFVQIEDCQKPAAAGEYRTEYDRPIYFIETRTGYICSWCEVASGRLFSIPHPLSPCRTRSFAFPAEAEIVGRVTGVAVRLAPAAASRQKCEMAAGAPIPMPAPAPALAGLHTA